MDWIEFCEALKKGIKQMKYKRDVFGPLVTGRQLKAARALAGLSQKEFAHECGLHFSSVAYIEQQELIGSAESTKDKIIYALERFGVKLTIEPGPGAYLVTGNEKRCNDSQEDAAQSCHADSLC